MVENKRNQLQIKFWFFSDKKETSSLPQSDIYALGVVIYEMLTGGERPFTGEHAMTKGSTYTRVRWEQLNTAVPSIHGIKPSLPLAVDAVITRCLDKVATNRYATPIELLNAMILATGVPDPNKTGSSALPAVDILRENKKEANREDTKTKSVSVEPTQANINKKNIWLWAVIILSVLCCLCVCCIAIPTIWYVFNQ